MDTHLEVVVIPVSDVDRAKASYSMLGWRLAWFQANLGAGPGASPGDCRIVHDPAAVRRSER